MADPIAEVVSFLKPSLSISKLVTGGGRWMVERTDLDSSFYCAMVEGCCRLTITGREPVILNGGDFVLIPEVCSFTMESIDPLPRGALAERLETAPGVFRLGDPQLPADVKMMVGHCAFATDDKALLVSLLPEVIHIHGEDRLALLVGMIHDETRSSRAARDMVLHRLLEVLLIEALRTAGSEVPPSLLRGMSDRHLAPALRGIHEDPARTVNVEALARSAGLSRSSFFERFRRELGVSPMEYATAWRMALAKEFLRRDLATTEIARRVGYGSASAFTAAFTRYVGTPPGAYARATQAS
ncbi:AraC family transcriptional regulator [Rhizobium sp. NTR19]|uniref:AraC family transcriptional regulator n=1 Tax=Neorhizobium turbinariae TaxID=2937795 RepID=A0ABT0INW5_9HYPH|nr:AraC family transcriptional regulator [Neorhizobium turbinariae]MCK8779557.1 AraC family transcriptional regulator [Neorhizobium turbinariae]